MDQREAWKCNIPEVSHGTVAIEKFSVSKESSDISLLRRSFVPPGNYTRLLVNGGIMMSDTPQEMRDPSGLLRHPKGHVLINGLGLGCCLKIVLAMPEVTDVTVVEKNQDVIDIVAPHFPEAEILHEDAFDWSPPKGNRFGAVWHDIWPDICLDNLSEMHRLHRKYGRRTEWQGSWSRDRLEYERRKDQKRQWSW